MATICAEIPPGPPEFAGRLRQVLSEWLAPRVDELMDQTPDLESVSPYRLEPNGFIVFAVRGDDPERLQGLAARAICMAAIPGISIEGGVALTLD